MHRLCVQLVEEICKPVPISGEQVLVGASIGAAAFPEDGPTADALLRSADDAMYKSKAAGRGCVNWSGQSSSGPALEKLRKEGELRQALARGEFELHYQPQFGASTLDLVGFEALLRWRKGDELLSSYQFVPLLNDLGIWQEVGDWVLSEACKEASRWTSSWNLAVNIDASQLVPELPARLKEILRDTGLKPHRLELELTESTLIQDEERAAQLLQGLSEMGLSLTLDDFGSGFSSLAYLRKFPFHKLKIDRELLVDQKNARLTGAVVELGHALGLSVAAQGVETECQLEVLRNAGCDFVQGFLMCRPLPTSALSNWVERGQAS